MREGARSRRFLLFAATFVLAGCLRGPTPGAATEPADSGLPEGAIPVELRSPDALQVATDGAVRQVRLRADHAFRIEAWASDVNLGADQQSLTLVYPEGALEALEPRCEALADSIRVQMSFAGSRGTLVGPATFPPGNYTLLVAAVPKATVRVYFDSAAAEARRVAGEATARQASFVRVDAWRDESVPRRSSFDWTLNLGAGGLVVAAFMAEVNPGAGLEEIASRVTSADGQVCGEAATSSPFARALFVGSAAADAGINLSRLPAGTYAYSGSYEAAYGVATDRQAGAFILS